MVLKFCHQCRHKLELGIEKFCPNCSIELEVNNSGYKQSFSHIDDNQGTVFGTGVTGNKNTFSQIFNVNISGMSKEDKEQLQKFIFTSEQLKQQPLDRTNINFISSLQAKIDELSKIYEQIKNVLDKVSEEEKNKGINIQEIKIGDKQISKNELSLKEDILKDNKYYYKQALANINKDTYEKTPIHLDESSNLDPNKKNILEAYEKKSRTSHPKVERENVMDFFSRTMVIDFYVFSIAISPDGTKIISSSDKTIKIWDLNTGTLLNTLKDHSWNIQSVVISPDGTKIISSSDKTIKIWDLNTGTLLNTLKGPISFAERITEDGAGKISCLTISPDGTKIINGFFFKRKINMWDLKLGKLINSFTASSHYSVLSVAISPDGTKLVGGLENNIINIWDLNTGTLLNTLKSFSKSLTVYYLVRFDSRLGVEALAISPDGTKIISGSNDNTIKIWDLNTGTLLNTLIGHSYYINSIAISPDGTKIISGSGDKTIKIWDLNTGTLLNTLIGHSDGIRSIAISPDGTKIISGSYDGTIRIWSKAT